jgi:2-polyprenyl-3-methyl-5-hydroxy-6-metoxy-1,4-benzoquinol methylase
MSESQQRLQALYMEKSKHSNYQVLATRLRSILGEDEIVVNTRSESERLKYVLNKLSVEGKSVIDIGANTGFFSFELLDAGAASVRMIEGNKDHAEFARLAAEVMQLEDKVSVTSEYFQFDGQSEERYDIGLLFNVLHHVGDDYGTLKSLEDTKRLILEQLNSMSQIVETLVFQLGFNWMGNPAKPLFEHGTKQEQIDYISEGVANHWTIESIGVAVGTRSQVRYEDLNEVNVARSDELGEFLNRPIFILKSTHGEAEAA